jgi:DNA-binding CsgD family transcriptional regulator
MNKRVSTSDSEVFQKQKLECLKLSAIELNVARLLAWGYSQKEIGEIIHRSPLTVNGHLRNIYKELGIHKETDLTRWYLFKEYCINDNPFKKIMAIFLLVLSISTLVYENCTVRVFRALPMRTAVRVAKPARVRRYINIFDLYPVTA